MIEISIIVPVYNKEEYIKDCIKSLEGQTITKELFEVICIDDGSTDKSYQILSEIQKQSNLNVRIYSQENKGVSFTRNRGMELAQGKYILFLDADDRISSNTLQDVSKFFEKNYDKTDIVTYPVFYESKGNITQGKRGKDIKEDCVIELCDLKAFPQTTINVCIKKLNYKTQFDLDFFVNEDQLFNTKHILKKSTIGWVASAKYIYRKTDDGASTRSIPVYAYDDFIEFYKRLEKLCENNNAKKEYVNSLFLYNLAWRIRSDSMWPYHLQGENFERAKNKLIEIINAINAREIKLNTWLSDEQKLYLLRLKEKKSVFPILTNGRWSLLDGTEILWEGRTVGLVIQRERVEGDYFVLQGFLKSPILNFVGKPLLFANYNGRLQEIELSQSNNSCYESKIKLISCWYFEIKKPVKEFQQLTFNVKINNISFPVSWWFREWNVINSVTKNFKHPLNDKETIIYEKGKLIKKNQCYDCGRFLTWDKKLIRSLAKRIGKKRIWLYCDFTNILDNGFLQFKHDIKKRDGVLRFYIYKGDISEAKKTFSHFDRIKFIKFGSLLHRILFISCEKIFTSYAGIQQISPYKKAISNYIDLLKAEIIYLQHGVMHAKCDQIYAKDRNPLINKIVVSTKIEAKYAEENLHFNKNEIICSGMPRLRKFETGRTNKILFAPSWRSYLVQRSRDENSWEAKANWEKSTYYQCIADLIQDSHLNAILNKNNYTLDIKLHPNFSCYQNNLPSADRIKIKSSIRLQEYELLITDFSSYMFDFLYSNIPVIQWIPDRMEFLGGMHSYREFISDFNDYTTVVVHKEELVEKIEEAIGAKNNNLPKELFFNIEDPCEYIYRELK